MNAGLTHDGAFPALTDQDWDEVISTSLDGFYNVLKPLIMPMIHLRKGTVLSLYLLCLELWVTVVRLTIVLQKQV